MQESYRYVAVSLALGAIAYFGSEAMFWVFAPDDAGLLEILVTVLAYALASSCVLSALALTGVGGFAGLFLGASLMGFLIEGVVVSTMYDAFPFQLVWTPLAWHALITGLAVFAAHRVLVHRSAAQQILAMVGLGLFGGLMGSYWPLERPVLPGPERILAYLIGTGVLAVAGHAALDRLPALPHPPRLVVWIMPGLAAVLWSVQSLADPRPQRLALPVVIGLTLWAMRRLAGGDAVSMGRPASLDRHALFLIAPLVTGLIAAFLVSGTAGFGSNVIVAFCTVPAGLGIWLWCLYRAARR